MDKKVRKKLLFFQQNELNAVAMYTRLAELVKNESIETELLKLATEEGKHASVIKNVTGEILRPKNLMKNGVVLGYRFLGKKAIFKMIASVDAKSADMYKKYADVFPPEVIAIADDELRHADIIRSL
ncbi:MAG: rubrerythrin [Clostridia bacterium]|nr:rubrerythrin [Clostridia bacterium]